MRVNTSWLRWVLVLPFALLSASLAMADEFAFPTDDVEVSLDEREAELARLFPDAAPLNFDPDVDRTLRLLPGFLKTEPAEAIRRWQAVLDGIANTNRSTGPVRLRSFVEFPEQRWRTFSGRVYARYPSIGRDVERTLAELPEDTRRLYELEFGPLAASLLEKARLERDPSLLREIEARYFLTDAGDDAVLRLAQLAFNRRDYAAASRLLQRVRDEHPQSDATETAAATLLILADARSGDVERGRELWKTFRRERPAAAAAVSEIVEASLRGAVGTGVTSSVSDDWRMPFGNPQRTGLRADVPPDALAERMTESWQVRLDITPEEAAPPGLRVGLPQGIDPRSTESGLGAYNGWRELRRSPASRPLAIGGRLYVRGNERVLCLDAESGRVLWMGLRNGYTIDGTSRAYGSRLVQFGALKRVPGEQELRWLFDRVHGSMAAVGGLLIAIEGELLDTNDSVPTSRANRITGQRRLRSNWLSAYEADTGRLVWRRPAGDGAEATSNTLGFAGTPIPSGGRFVVPVIRGGEVWLKGIEPATGATIWSTMLCDDAPGGSSPWSPVGVSAAGDRAFVVAGTGLVFCVDTRSGNVVWAVRYRRSSRIKLAQGSRRLMRGPTWDFFGWNEDTIVAYGRLLLVFATDNDHLVAFDRRTGALAWETPARPDDGEPIADEFLGLSGDGIVVAGAGVVRRYGAATGRLEWESRIESPVARGIVTEKAVYVPVESGVRVLDVRTGEPLTEHEFITPTRHWVGNLALVDHRLFAVDPARVYGLAPLESRLIELAGRIERGDLDARLERARVRTRLDDLAGAEADIVAAINAFDPRTSDIEFARRVLETMTKLELAKRRPRETLAVLLDEGPEFATTIEADEDARMNRDGLLYRAITSIAEQPAATGSVGLLARTAERFGERYLFDAARQAASRTATNADLDVISELLRGETEEARFVAAAALESKDVDDELARELLRRVLNDDDDDAMRLEATFSLVNRGDRTALSEFVALLESADEDVRKRSLRSLRVVSGLRLGDGDSAFAEDRVALAAAWERWATAAVTEGELRLPLHRARLLLGRTLVASIRTHEVIELDSAGKVVWKTAVRSPQGCFGTLQGHRVVASYQEKYVREFDRDGKLVWDMSSLPGRPFGVSRLVNGNTLVAFYDTGAVIEYGPLKNTVWEWKPTLRGNSAHAVRLKNGRTLIAWWNQNAVIEVDRAGKIVWRADNMFGPRSVQRLPNGNTLVAQSRKGRVVEIDRAGKVVWERAVSNPQGAQRLPDGKTIIVGSSGVIEVTPDSGETFRQISPLYGSAVHQY